MENKKLSEKIPDNFNFKKSMSEWILPYCSCSKLTLIITRLRKSDNWFVRVYRCDKCNKDIEVKSHKNH